MLIVISTRLAMMATKISQLRIRTWMQRLKIIAINSAKVESTSTAVAPEPSINRSGNKPAVKVQANVLFRFDRSGAAQLSQVKEVLSDIASMTIPQDGHLHCLRMATINETFVRN